MDSHPIPRISLESVSSSYGARKVLRSVDCSFYPGEITGIVGPNGAGKTTMLKLINRIVQPDAGEIRFDGLNLSACSMSFLARKIAYMAQFTPVQFDFSVLEIVLFGRYPYLHRLAWESRDDVEKAVLACGRVGLKGFEDRLYAELSSGEKTLVLFAKTLVQETGVLLLDEPVSNLDLHFAERIFSILIQLSKEGKTIIMSLHNLDMASRYCTRLIMLDKGEIVSYGKPQDVLTPLTLDAVYGITTRVIPDPFTGGFFVSVLHE